MLSGYSPETNGTIVVTDGSNAVIASNDETLIGRSAEEMCILRRIVGNALPAMCWCMRTGRRTIGHSISA